MTLATAPFNLSIHVCDHRTAISNQADVHSLSWQDTPDNVSCSSASPSTLRLRISLHSSFSCGRHWLVGSSSFRPNVFSKGAKTKYTCSCVFTIVSTSRLLPRAQIYFRGSGQHDSSLVRTLSDGGSLEIRDMNRRALESKRILMRTINFASVDGRGGHPHQGRGISHDGPSLHFESDRNQYLDQLSIPTSPRTSVAINIVWDHARFLIQDSRQRQ